MMKLITLSLARRWVAAAVGALLFFVSASPALAVSSDVVERVVGQVMPALPPGLTADVPLAAYAEPTVGVQPSGLARGIEVDIGVDRAVSGRVAGVTDRGGDTSALQLTARVLLVLLIIGGAGGYLYARRRSLVAAGAGAEPARQANNSLVTLPTVRGRRWVIIGLIAVAVVVLIVVGVRFSRNLRTMVSGGTEQSEVADSSSGASSYQSYRYGYSLTFPDDWILDDSHTRFPVDLIGQPSGVAAVLIGVEEDFTLTSPDAIAQAVAELVANKQISESFEVQTTEQLTFKGYPAAKAVGRRRDSTGVWYSFVRYVVFVDTGKFYAISGEITEGREGQFLTAVNQIIDSFAVTDVNALPSNRMPGTVAAVAETQTCTNELGSYGDAQTSVAQQGDTCVIEYQADADASALQEWYVKNVAAAGWRIVDASVDRLVSSSGDVRDVFALAKCSKNSPYDQQAVVAVQDGNVTIEVETIPRDQSACTISAQPALLAAARQELGRAGFEPATTLDATYSAQGFTLRYPSSWHVSEFTSQQEEYFDLDSLQSRTIPSQGVTFTKGVSGSIIDPTELAVIEMLYTESTDVSPIRVYEDMEKRLRTWRPDLISYSYGSLGGSPALIVTYPSTGQAGPVKVYDIGVVVNGRLFHFSATAPTATWDKHQAELMEILRSLSST